MDKRIKSSYHTTKISRTQDKERWMIRSPNFHTSESKRKLPKILKPSKMVDQNLKFIRAQEIDSEERDKGEIKAPGLDWRDDRQFRITRRIGNSY